MNLPTITVGIVKGRDNQHWLDLAVKSVSNQLYLKFQELELIIIDNIDRKKSIGRCFNEIAEKAKGDWVFYLGDDDHIVPEYLVSLMLRYNQSKKNNKTKEIVNIISLSTIFNKTRKEVSTKSPTGIWNTQYVLDNPFNEELKRWVDTEMFKRLDMSDLYFPCVASHQYGYYYRQHEDNVSGNKFDKGDYDSARPEVVDFKTANSKEIKEMQDFVNVICSNMKGKNIGDVKTDKNIIGLISKTGAVYPLSDVVKEYGKTN
jgi:glycosyltransferase involved in cell wall biosynthesis